MTDVPLLLRSAPPDPSSTQLTLQVDEDLRSLLRSLPSRSDLEVMMQRMEETHRRELREVKTEVQMLATRLTAGESSIATLGDRVSALETAQVDTAVALQLALEDRSRRNNIRLRGLPEATGREDLEATTTAIITTLLGAETPGNLELDRVHRALGPRPTDPGRPRDVICRLHHYTHKDAITRKAWELGLIDFDGAPIKILPDVSRATLQRRALLRPLLNLARDMGVPYSWVPTGGDI